MNKRLTVRRGEWKGLSTSHSVATAATHSISLGDSTALQDSSITCPPIFYKDLFKQ